MAALDWLTARPIAHRGYHDRHAGRLENTLSAAEAAIARSFAVECDLQLTADGAVIVFHDDTLDRLTDLRGPVAAKSLAELKAARLSGSTDRIPTLAELLETVAGRVPLLIEFKSRWNGDRRLEQQAAAVLKSYAGAVAVMSFDPMSMQAMQGLAPDLPRGLTADRFASADYPGLSRGYRLALRQLAYTPVVGARFIAYGVHCLPASAPLLLRHLGMPLLTWTVRTPAERAVAARCADQIIFEDFDPELPSPTASPG